MDKQQITDALSKPLKEITDKELVGIIEIPELFWPTNPYEFTMKGLIEEQQRRAKATSITFEDVLADVVYLSTLRHLISFGPRIFQEIDNLGIDSITEQIRKLEPKVKVKIKKYKQENNIQ